MATRPFVDLKSLAALLFEWLIIGLAMLFALRTSAWWAYAIAFVVIATRQHGLLMLYHDAVHGHLARRCDVNDFLINLLVGVPHLLPVEVYRPLHLKHHRTLGTGDDPERKMLYAGQPWNYRPLTTRPLLRQLLGDLFVLNGLRTMTAWRKEGGTLAMRAATLLPVMLWWVALVVLIRSSPASAVVVLLLWLMPLLTLTNSLQKLRSFAEHSGGPGVTPGWNDWTYSWRIGWPGRLTIWPYNINYHREHHRQPDIAWHRLPGIACDKAYSNNGSGLRRLLYRR